jgi:hypothetical protein
LAVAVDDHGDVGDDDDDDDDDDDGDDDFICGAGEDDDDVIQDDEARLQAKTVEQLKAMCRARGLKVGGRKAELIARLIEG